MMARTDSTQANQTAGRLFNADRPVSRGRTLVYGFLVGSAISVVMLVLALAIGAAYGAWNDGMALCLSYIIAGVAGGVLQQTWFSPNMVSKMRYPGRLAGFGITYFVVLVGCAVLGSWMPAYAPIASWCIFAGIFIAVFVAISVAFAIRFRKQGGNYDELLTQYRAKQADGKHDAPQA